jgi:hypothetical protein
MVRLAAGRGAVLQTSFGSLDVATALVFGRFAPKVNSSTCDKSSLYFYHMKLFLTIIE